MNWSSARSAFGSGRYVGYSGYIGQPSERARRRALSGEHV